MPSRRRRRRCARGDGARSPCRLRTCSTRARTWPTPTSSCPSRARAPRPPPRSYLHGPFESVGPGVGLIAFGGARELALAGEAAGYGATATVVTRAGERGAEAPPDVQVIELPPAIDLAAPILDILAVQVAV